LFLKRFVINICVAFLYMCSCLVDFFLLVKKVIAMHVMGVKNLHDVLLEVSPLVMQVHPQRVKHCKGLT
jgi:hypothetical protein